MGNFKFRIIFFLAFAFIFINVKSQTLIMNEVSNGPSGSQEYVEFVVVSNTVTYTCSSPTPPCIDIRGWIFDDNSGYHGTSGVAAGAVRFSNNPLWSCIPLGTIILIYNDADKNPGIPPTDDLSMADGNCTIIAPISNASLFERNTTTPGAAACSYPATGWVAGGSWSFTALANTSDCARIVNLAGCEVFSVCYGTTNNLNTLIYFPASGTGTVYSFNSVDPQLQANWTSGSATTMQTPGAPNNAANAAYIAQFNNGCLPITQPSVTAVGVNAGCTCNGSATANASGSIAGYTYVWYDASMNPIGQTSATATGLCAGVYHVIATSQIGCTATTSVVISSSSSTSVSVNSQTICAGTSAILTANPSTAGGTFSWTPGGQTTSSISVSPGSTTTYSVIYTLAGCSGTNNGVVTVKPLPIVTVNSPTICSGQTATLTANGATTYLWNTGSTANPLTASPTTNTNYTVAGTANGCTNTALSNVSVTPLPTVTVSSSTICSGQTATLTANGATSYVWNTGSTTNPLTVSPTSNTSFTVTGTTNGCTNTVVSNVVVNSNPTVTVNPPTICSGQTATLTASGASSYSWNTGATTTTIIVSPTTTTNYTVLGISVGCTNTAVASVSVAATPTVTVNSPVICAGQTATLTANGAATYVWNTSSTSNPLTVSPTSSTNFTVTGTTNGCTNTAVSNVSVTPLPTVTVSSSTICSGQTATLIANGATTYVWNTGSTTNPLTVSPTSNTNFTVTGATNGCTNTSVSNVVVNSNPTVTVNPPIICSGQAATLTASGASSYIWDTGATTNTIVVSPSSTTNYTVLGASVGCTNTVVASLSVTPLPTVTVNSPSICIGQTATITASGATSYVWNTGSTTNPLIVSPTTNTIFTVTGTTNGCINTAVANVSVTPLPLVSVNSSTICAGLTATLTANGASTYTWSNGTNNGSLSDNPLTTTNYTVTGEQLGCINSATANIVINSNLSLSVNEPTICSGQTATLTSTGATTYTWSNGSIGNSIIVSPATTTSFTVFGNNGACFGSTVTTVFVNPLPIVTVNSSTICSGQTSSLTANGAIAYLWNTGSTSNLISVSPLSNTSYTVLGTSLGCTNTAIADVSVTPLPTVTVNSSTICSGQTATITASGANTYSWNNGSLLSTLTDAPAINTTYTVIGAALGCTSTAIANVSVTPLPTVTVTSSTICIGQTATITANGASTYVWSTGSLSNTITDTPSANTSYTVLGSSLNCTNSAIANVSVTPLPTVTVNSSTICSGQTATLIANGASTYLWNTGATGSALVISPTVNASFSVVGTNAGCSNTVSTIVNVVSSPILSVNSTTICAGQTTTLSVSGASSYVWNNGTTTNTTAVSPVVTTTFSVVGSIGTCNTTTTVNVVVNPLPIISVPSITICAGQSATLTAVGASVYNWNTNSNLNPLVVSPNATTTYSVTGTNLNCTSSTTATVFVENSPTVAFNSINIAGCAPLCSQFSDLTTVVSGTISSWNWSFGDGFTSNSQNPSHCFDNSGLYDISLTVISSNGCSKTYTNLDMIQVYPNPTAEFSSNVEETDVLNPIVDFTNLSSNANSYEWSFGSLTTSTVTNPSYTYNQEGIYSTTLTATNQYGCKDVAIHDIIVKGIFTFYAPNTFTPNDDNKNDIFLPLGVGWDPEKYQLDIFDRWGNYCFTTKEVGQGWDGKANKGSESAQIDTYTWKVDLTDIFGKSHKYIGKVTIIR
jgi:gliding motility-associated-like protein